MRNRSSWALLVLVAALSGVGVSSVYLGAAYADHSPAGSGGCTGHTRTCYPNCWWEWTGQRGSVTDPPVDVGPCSLPADVRPDQLPPVSGTVSVVNPAGERLDVDAICEAGATCISNAAQADVVRLADGMGERYEFGLGVLIFLGATALVVGYRAFR